MAPATRRRTTTKAKKTTLTGQALKLATREFLSLKTQVADITKRMNERKATLMSTVETEGYEDDKGNYILEFPEPVDSDAGTCRGLKREKRTSQVLDEDVAEKILKKKGIYDDCVEVIEVLQPDAITKAYFEGKLTEAEIDRMFSTRVIYAFVPLMEK